MDSVDLVMSERSGVEIDYCPQCRGVWLDRGELDKIIDRVAADPPPAPAPHVPSQPPIAPPPLYNPFESRPGQPRYDDRGVAAGTMSGGTLIGGTTTVAMTMAASGRRRKAGSETCSTSSRPAAR